MAITDRIKAVASQVGRTVGEVVREGVSAYAAVTRAQEPPPVLPDVIEKGRSMKPTGAEFDPLDAYGKITEDGAMTGTHPGTMGTPMVTLERFARLSVPALVINHVVDEISEFCRPQTTPYSYGFKIVLDDIEKEPTGRQKKTMAAITKLINAGGGKYQDGGFEGFSRRIWRNSLVLDAAAAQILTDRAGMPIGLFAYDAKTIRKRTPTADWISTGRWGENPGYLQWVDQRVWAEWDANEFMYGIRRPRTDLDTFGYGFPELDELTGTLLSFARAENYNAVNFTSGVHASHMLAIISAMDREAFGSYRRMFEANFSAANQKRRLPVIQLDPEQKEDIKAISLGNTNKEMEYSNWLFYLVKLMCAAYGVDPAAALGMQFGNEGQSSSLGNTSPADRMEQSKAHGVRIKLRQYASWLTPVVKMIDPEMSLVFGGFEAVTEAEKIDMDIKQLANFVTVNEVRARYDLEPIEGPAGDVIANPYVSQAQTMQQMQDQQQADQTAGAFTGGGQPDQNTFGAAPSGGGNDWSGAADQQVMSSLHRDPYLRNGGNVDTITKAAVGAYSEALRRKLVTPPPQWRPGRPWSALDRGGGREPIVVEVRV